MESQREDGEGESLVWSLVCVEKAGGGDQVLRFVNIVM